MADKNLAAIIKGRNTASGGGIKVWDATPTFGDEANVVGMVGFQYNGGTRRLSTNFNNGEYTVGVPRLAVAKTDMTFGSLEINEAKRFGFKITESLRTFDPNNTNYFGLVWFPSNMTAAQAHDVMYGLFSGESEPVAPFLGFFATQSSDGTVLIPGVNRLLDFFNPEDGSSGYYPSMGFSDGDGFDWSKFEDGSSFVAYFARKEQPEDWVGVAGLSYIAATMAGFSENNELFALGELNSIQNSPEIPPSLTCFYMAMTIPTTNTGSYPVLTMDIDEEAGRDDLSIPSGFGELNDNGYSGPLQPEWDDVYGSEVLGIVPVIQAEFPPSTKVNDEFRVVVQSGFPTAKPYGKMVTNESLITVNSVMGGEESFRINIDSDYLDSRLGSAGLDVPLSQTLASFEMGILAADQSAGYVAFWIIPENSIPDEMENVPRVHTSFGSAYVEALTMPSQIPKKFIFWDVGYNKPLGIPAPPVEVGVWYLAANNISLTTTTAWLNPNRHDPFVNSNVTTDACYTCAVDIKGVVDGLHLDGGAYRLFWGAENPYSPFITYNLGGSTNWTSTQYRNNLELGDGTAVFISPLASDFRWIVGNMKIGENCSIFMFPNLGNNTDGNNHRNNYWDSADFYSNDQVNNGSRGRTAYYQGTFNIKAGRFFRFRLYGAPANLSYSHSFNFEVDTRPGEDGPVIQFDDEDVTHSIVYRRMTDTSEVENLLTQLRSEVLPIPFDYVISSKEALLALALNSTVEGGITYYDMPAGKYMIGMYNPGFTATERLRIGNLNGGRFELVGVPSTTLHFVIAGSVPFITSSSPSTKGEAVKMTNLGIFLQDTNFNGTPYTGGRTFLDVKTDANPVFENCSINYGTFWLTGSDITTSENIYNDCKFYHNGYGGGFVKTAGTIHGAIFNRCEFAELDGWNVITPIFPLGDTQLLGRIELNECRTRLSADRVLVDVGTAAGVTYLMNGVAQTGAGVVTTMNGGVQTGAIVMRNCKALNAVASAFGGSLAIGDVQSVPTFREFNDTVPLRLSKKHVVDIYKGSDFPSVTHGSGLALLPDTIYRIHGPIPFPSGLVPRAGTEFVGASGDTLQDSLEMDRGTTDHAGMVLVGDDVTFRNITLRYFKNTVNNCRAVAICYDRYGYVVPALLGASQYGSYKTGNPNVFQNVFIDVQGDEDETAKVAISLLQPVPFSGETEKELSIVLDNVWHNGDYITAGSTAHTVENIEIKNTQYREDTTPLAISFDRQSFAGNAMVDDTNGLWTGSIKLSNNEFVSEPILLDAGQAWRDINQVSNGRFIYAWQNRHCDSAGVLAAGTLGSYCNQWAIANDVIKAEGNIFGAPNTP